MIRNGLIQIAGITDDDEARLLENCGITFLGFPLRLPVNQEDLSEDEAARIIRRLQPPCHGVLITYLTEAREISEFCSALGTDVVQLHADVDITQLAELKSIEPALTVIKSLVVGLHGDDALAEMVGDYSPYVDAFITDTYDPASGASGATGKTHDWSISRRLVELSKRPVILAGGLTPDNVRGAIVAVRPAGVDAHTGVEDESGRKSRRLVTQFVREAIAGFNAAHGSQ